MDNEELLDFFTLLFCTRVDFPEFFVLHLLPAAPENQSAPTHYNITKIKANSYEEKVSKHARAASSLAELGSEIIQPVSSYKELQKCLRNPKVTLCRLTSSIETTESIIINRDIVIDLGGYEIKSDTKNVRVIDILKGNVALIGTGSVIANGNGGVAIRIRGSDDPNAEKYSSVTVGAEVLLQATSNDFSYGLIVSPNRRAAYGLTVNLFGVIDAYNGVYINGNVITKKGNIPVINIDNGAAISVDAEHGTAIYAAGYGIWKLGDATLVGGNGIDIKMGRLIIDGATVSVSALSQDSSKGSVIQIEDTDNNATCVDIKIKDGTLTSQNNHIFYEYSNCHAKTQSLRRLRISGGNMTAGLGKQIFYDLPQKDTIQISGGSFNCDVFDFLAPQAKISSSTTRDERGRISRIWEVTGVNNHEAEYNIAQKAKLQATKLALAKVALASINDPLESYYHQVNYDLPNDEEDYNNYLANDNYNIETSNFLAESLTIDDATINPEPVDCTILSEILEAAENIDQTSYTKESYNNLAEVLSSARVVLDHPTLASQEDVDRIVIAVALATTNLVENPREDLQNLSLATVRSYAEPQPVVSRAAEEPAVIYPEPAYEYAEQMPTQFPPQKNPTYMGNSNYQTYSPTYNYYNYPAPIEMMYPNWQNNLMTGQPASYLPAQTYSRPPALPEPTQNYNYNYNYLYNHNQIVPEKSSTSAYGNFQPTSSDFYNHSASYYAEAPQLANQFTAMTSNIAPQQNPSNLSSMSEFNYPDNSYYETRPEPSSQANYRNTFSNSPSLNAAIAEAKEISAMDYTLSSFAELQHAIYAAEDIVRDRNATIEELDAASFNLSFAISNLEKESTDTLAPNSNLNFYEYGQSLYY